jgi:predicted secreted protein
MPKPNKAGRSYLLYVATTAPDAAASASDAAYSLGGLLRNLSLSRTRNAIDASTKDSGDDSTFIAGRRNQSFTADFVFDHSEDAGYTKLSDAYESASATVYWLITSTTTGDTEWTGSGIVTDLSLAFPDEDVSTYNLAVQASGAVTEATGTST